MRRSSFIMIAFSFIVGSACVAADPELADDLECEDDCEPGVIAAFTPPADSLRKLGWNVGLRIGAGAVKKHLLESDETYAAIIRDQFNYLTPSFEMKMQYTQPQRGVFDFTRADPIVDFAARHGQRVHGHTLVWHINTPAWLTQGQFSNAQKIDIMKAHIKGVVGHFRSEYPGDVIAWDVVNEALRDDGTVRPTVWSTIGYPKYIEIAFQAAHAADSSAKLFYNDYSIEGITAKSTAVYNLVKDLKAKGIPIHGVGIQAHMNTDDAVLSLTALRDNIRRFGALGLKVRYTELDVRVKTSDGTSATERDRTSAFYRNLVRACRLEKSTCLGVSFWGINPDESWIKSTFPGYSARLLYDGSYHTTAAYDIVKDELQ